MTLLALEFGATQDFFPWGRWRVCQICANGPFSFFVGEIGDCASDRMEIRRCMCCFFLWVDVRTPLVIQELPYTAVIMADVAALSAPEA